MNTKNWLGGVIPKDLEETDPVLEEALRNGGVSEFITAGLTTYEELSELEDIHLSCLRLHPTIQAVKDQRVTIAQIAALSEDQAQELYDETLEEPLTGKKSPQLARLVVENAQKAEVIPLLS